jgi:TonB family protein
MQYFKFLLTGIIICLFSCAITPQKAKTESGENFVAFEEPPTIIHKVDPEYPPNAMDMNISGTIWMRVLVDTLGDVKEARIARNEGENITFFKDSVIDAAFKTKWKPAKSKGRPISVWVTYKVDFGIK